MCLHTLPACEHPASVLPGSLFVFFLTAARVGSAARIDGASAIEDATRFLEPTCTVLFDFQETQVTQEEKHPLSS